MKISTQQFESKLKAMTKNTKRQCLNLKKGKDKNKIPNSTRFKSKENSVKVRKSSFKCEHCVKTFSKVIDLTIHMNTHLQIKPYSCKFCSRNFINPTTFMYHNCSKKKIDQLKTYQCTICDKTFHQKITFLMHKRSHNKPKMYECHLCPQKFVLKSSFFAHKMIHSSKFECKTCLKIFTRPSQLEEHKSTHMHDLAIFKCLYCPKILKNQIKYEKHINFHIQQKTLEGKRELLKEEENSVSGISQLPKVTLKTENKDSFYIVPQKKVTNDSDKKTEDFKSKTSFFIGSTRGLKNFSKKKEIGDCKIESDLTIEKLECALCELSFDSVPLFVQHVHSHEASSENSEEDSDKNEVVVNIKTIYACKWCHKKFMNFDFAVEHVMFFAKSPDDLHSQCLDGIKCDIIGEEMMDRFMHKISMGNVKKKDTSGMDKILIYHCSKCNTNFENQQSLIFHIDMCNKETPQYRCPKCKINFQNKFVLRDHIQLGHKKIVSHPSVDLIISPVTVESTKDKRHIKEQLSCKKCDIVFSSSREFIEHREIKHKGKSTESIRNEVSTYSCARCNLDFLSQADFYKHLSVHVNEKAPAKNYEAQEQIYKDSITGCWICTTCKKSFSNKSNATRHVTLHDKNEKKDHICPFCSRVFQYKRYLQHHIMYMHKAEDQKNQYSCNMCKKDFSSNYALKRHMKLHTGESELTKVFKCDYCNLKCKCREEFKLHMRVHTGEKPFSCDLCSFQAAVYYNLKKHIEKVHETPKQPIQKQQRRKKLKKDSKNNSV